jgi:hypothetical protein
VIKRLFVFLVSIALFSGCAVSPRFTSHVTVFHQMSKPAGLTFMMVPLADQLGSLEYDSYSKAISGELKRFGMEQVQTSDRAAVSVYMRYSIDTGTAVTSSYPIIGQTGVSGSTTYGTVSQVGNMATVNASTTYTPTFGVVGTGVSTDTVYKRSLDLQIMDTASLSSGSPRKLYEAQVRSEGTSPQLARVMPYMIESLFKEFPGMSGAVRTHAIEEKTK